MRTKNKIQERTKHHNDKEKYFENNLKHRAENKDAIRQQPRENTKETKQNKCNKKRKTKTKQRRTAANQPIATHAYYIFYSFHLVYSIYYSSYHDQLISLCISFHSIHF